MSRESVKDFMRRAEAVYKAASVEVVKDYEKVLELQKAQADVNRSMLLTPQGKDEKRRELAGQIKDLEKHMAELRADANKRAGEIRDDMEKTFFAFYHVAAADVDMQMVTLINSGVVSDKELAAMAKTANPTMRRLIAKKLSESEDAETARQGRSMLISSNPHMEAMRGIMGIGDYTVGGAPMTGASGAKAFFDRWDELTAPIYDNAPNVERVYRAAKAPGSVLFSTPDNPIPRDDD